jgi:hypothetical protein
MEFSPEFNGKLNNYLVFIYKYTAYSSAVDLKTPKARINPTTPVSANAREGAGVLIPRFCNRKAVKQTTIKQAIQLNYNHKF